ncbi:MAG: hypothetical protein KKF78_03470 [Candidatus Omnitrophica bacterium]|nr:hypothetical protein [Candidatus Omnitrophota bacterium]MBU1996198.1 hypothetical protein [Candidatus Omnitrophota bacterium]
MKCPNHDVELVKKEIIYGYPASGKDYSNVLLGGCCVMPNSPRYGYECPVDKEVYLMKDGKLVTEREEED